MNNSSPLPVVGWRTVLGLGEEGEIDWGRVRAGQLRAVAGRAAVRIVVSTLGVGALLAGLWTQAPRVRLIGWGACVMLLTLHGWVRRRRARFPLSQSVSVSELHGETLWAAVMGVAWGAAPLLFAPYAGRAELLTLWATALVMMAWAAFGLSVLPLATVVYLWAVGGSLAFATWQLHLPLVAAIAAAYAVGMSLATSFAGRKFIAHEAANQALVEKTEVVSLLLREFDDKGGDWMWQIDAARCLTHVSARFATALGTTRETLEQRPFLEILAGKEAWERGSFPAALHELAEKLKAREAFADLVLPVQVGEEAQWWELSASPRFDERGSFIGFRGVGSDVTAARRSADKINHMARFDTLTGLPNRLNVTEALAAALMQAERWRGKCAFLMIDLDRFKAINDTLGHPMGDRLLMRVAERLRNLMREGETCGRLGGDEFAVVIPDLRDQGRLDHLARGIVATLSEPYDIDHQTLYIGASVGTAIGPRDGRSVETLIRSADLALYRSKDEGGSSIHAYEPQLHSHAEERRVLEIALRQALEKRELAVHYQPVVNAQSGEVESFEALLRWTHPQLGPISPAKFVPIAEDTRLIGPIGDWVLATACEEAKHWPDHVRIAVNVSPEQLTNPGFVGTVLQVLARTGLSPDRLELEVTESVFLREGKGAVSTLDQLLGLGLRLALDDFGTGYSSLGYLSKTKFNTIKVDRSFVTQAARNVPEALAIIRAVVALANSLDMSTTAEGVETDRELTMLRDLGAKKIQGYLFGRPMPAGEARRLFQRAKVA